MAAPAPAPTEEEKLAKGSSDLRFLLTSHGVASATQAELYRNGINSLAKFAAFVSGEADLKTVLKDTKDSFGLDPAVSLANRAQAASMVVAWNTAATRVKNQAEVEAMRLSS